MCSSDLGIEANAEAEGRASARIELRAEGRNRAVGTHGDLVREAKPEAAPQVFFVPGQHGSGGGRHGREKKDKEKGL